MTLMTTGSYRIVRAESTSWATQIAMMWSNTAVDTDAEDLAMVSAVLAKIDADPSRVIRGDALQARLRLLKG